MLPDEQKEEDQTPPEIEKNLRQSLNDLLYEAHSPDNDTFIGSKLTKRVSMSALINHKKHLNENVMEEQVLEDMNDSQYEKLSLSNN